MISDSSTLEIASSRATRVLVSMERPVTTILRPHFLAASHLLGAVDMAGEGRDEHARPGASLIAAYSEGADLSLRPGEPDGRVGGIGKQQIDPLLGELVDRRVVGESRRRWGSGRGF